MGGGLDPPYGPRVISLFKEHNRFAYLELLQLEFDKLLFEQEVDSDNFSDIEEAFGLKIKKDHKA